MFKTILLPTNGSDHANRNIKAVIEFAKEHGSKIVGLSVEEAYPYFPLGDLDDTALIRTYADAIRQCANDHVKIIADICEMAGVPCEVHTASGGAPHEKIVQCAEQYKCDSIFMSSQGRHGLEKILLGSQTQKVLAHSLIPVVVLK